MKNLSKLRKSNKETQAAEQAFIEGATHSPTLNREKKESGNNSAELKSPSSLESKKFVAPKRSKATPPLSVVLDDTTKLRFKSLTSIRGEKMTPLVYEWINKYIEKHWDELPAHLKDTN